MIVHTEMYFSVEKSPPGQPIVGSSVLKPGSTCAMRMPRPPSNKPLNLEIELIPFVQAPPISQQRLSIRAGATLIATVVLDRSCTLCFNLPREAIGTGKEWILALAYTDAARAVWLKRSGDNEQPGVMVRAVRLIEVTATCPILPRSLGPMHISEPTPAALGNAVRAHTGLGTAELLRGFESLGHNCEFGLMQRNLDAEPLGLLRFGGIEPSSLLAGLQSAFAGIEDAHGLVLEHGRMNGRQEYLVRDQRFGVRIHTGRYLDEVPSEAVDIPRMGRYLGFLQRHFADVLRDSSRIFVLHHPDLHDAARALPILNRLRGHGENVLLYVTEHPTVPPGTVVMERDHLFHGYIDRLVPMNEATRINLGGWVSLCANAYRLARNGTGSPP